MVTISVSDHLSREFVVSASFPYFTPTSQCSIVEASAAFYGGGYVRLVCPKLFSIWLTSVTVAGSPGVPPWSPAELPDPHLGRATTSTSYLLLSHP